MKVFITIVIILAVVFYFLGARAPERPPAPAAPAATVAPAPSAPAQPTPNAAPGGSDLRANQNVVRMRAAAKKVGVELRQYAPQPPSGAMVAIAWTGDNMALGGDFLDECRKQGIIRDFDLNNKREGMGMENGKRVFTAQYLVFF